MLDMSNLLWYWDPYYYRTQRRRIQSGGKMNFVEAVFSAVFGDGDPNAAFDRERWEAVSYSLLPLCMCARDLRLSGWPPYTLRLV